jgi:hypothetical protein
MPELQTEEEVFDFEGYLEDDEQGEIEYIIYCRKSTDESSGKQAQSIPDQIRQCLKYAKDNNLKIRKKTKSFSFFENETSKSIEADDFEFDTSLEEETKGLFIVKEQET